MIVHDISQNIMQCQVYPGDPKPEFSALERIANGDQCNLTSLSMCLHTGTHIDAPCHYCEDGKTIAELGVEPFVGECHVISVNCNITGLFIEQNITPGMEKVIFKTNGCFYLDKSGANALLDTNVRLVGTDGLSIASSYDETDTHRILLANDISIIEGLKLDRITHGRYFLFAPPINTGHTDAAPCRALLLEREEGIAPLPVFGKMR